MSTLQDPGRMPTWGGPTGLQLLLLQCVLLYSCGGNSKMKRVWPVKQQSAPLAKNGTLPVLSCAQACDLK